MLGGRTVAEWQDHMPASEFEEWKIILERDPPPDVKRQYEAALVASTIARAFGGGKGQIRDFLIQYGPPKRRDPMEIATKLATFANMHNAQQSILKRRDEK